MNDLPRTPTLLIADDNTAFVHSLERLIRPLGFRCVTDTTSGQVLELARTVRPDLIVLDVKQGIDGRDLLMKLKSDVETKDIPVIMLSAHDDHYLRRVCFELGAVDYAVKPVDVLFLQRLARFAKPRAELH